MRALTALLARTFIFPKLVFYLSLPFCAAITFTNEKKKPSIICRDKSRRKVLSLFPFRYNRRRHLTAPVCCWMVPFFLSYAKQPSWEADHRRLPRSCSTELSKGARKSERERERERNVSVRSDKVLPSRLPSRKNLSALRLSTCLNLVPLTHKKKKKRVLH